MLADSPSSTLSGFENSSDGDGNVGNGNVGTIGSHCASGKVAHLVIAPCTLLYSKQWFIISYISDCNESDVCYHA